MGDHPLRQRQPVDLDGATVTAYFNRGDNVAVRVPGSAAGNVAAVTMKQECYAIDGPLLGIFRITLGGMTLTASVLRFVVGKGPYGAIVDAGKVIPSLDDLMAQIEAMERATSAANTAAENAQAAANAAAASASAIGSMTASAESLPAGSTPTAAIVNTETGKILALGIPAGLSGPAGPPGPVGPARAGRCQRDSYEPVTRTLRDVCQWRRTSHPGSQF